MTEEEMMLSNSDEPWVWAPRYIEVLKKRQSTDPEESAYWSQFGFDKLTKPDSTHIPYVHNRWSILVARFNNRYYFRRIGNETMERWQIRMQNKFDEVVDEMERAYKLYATTTNIDEVTAGTKTTYGHSSTTAGQDLTTGNSSVKNISTPDSAINANDNYADSLTKGNSSNSGSHSSTTGMTGTDRTEVLGPDVLSGVNRSITAWVDVDTFFIEQFENLFLNIFD